MGNFDYFMPTIVNSSEGQEVLNRNIMMQSFHSGHKSAFYQHFERLSNRIRVLVLCDHPWITLRIILGSAFFSLWLTFRWFFKVHLPSSSTHDQAYCPFFLFQTEEIGILKQFPFSSGLQRMSVIARTASAPNYSIFVKGAPETVALMCEPSSGSSADSRCYLP